MNDDVVIFLNVFLFCFDIILLYGSLKTQLTFYPALYLKKVRFLMFYCLAFYVLCYSCSLLFSK